MANTERLNTLQCVKDAIDTVSKKQEKLTNKKSDEWRALQRAYIVLTAAEDKLIYEDMVDVVDKLEKAANRLGGVVKEMNDDLNGLRTVAKVIDKAATALGALAQIVSKAASAGIL